MTVSTRTNVYKPEKSSVLIVKKKFTCDPCLTATKKRGVTKLLLFSGVNGKISPPRVTLNRDPVHCFGQFLHGEMNVSSFVHRPNIRQSSGGMTKKLRRTNFSQRTKRLSDLSRQDAL